MKVIDRKVKFMITDMEHKRVQIFREIRLTSSKIIMHVFMCTEYSAVQVL